MDGDHIIAGGKNRLNYLELLELAMQCHEDEFQNITYKFEYPFATITLFDSALDGDISVQISVPGQSSPIVKLDLADCAEVKAVNDKRGKYLEFVGQLQVDDYTRGSTLRTTGFRLHLEPNVLLEPFFKTGA
jgi:hypothetical protein